MAAPEIHLRTETKEFEQRSALTPSAAKTLIGKGWRVYVERDDEKTYETGKRVFADKEFEEVGCELVPNNSYRSAPPSRPILGLKELLPIPLPSASTYPLSHTHITFAHCYKRQGGWSDVLNRWVSGKGMLYDLEFLVHPNGRRVAAFGFWAGWVGAAVGVLAVGEQTKGGRLGPLKPWENEHACLKEVKRAKEEAERNLGRKLRVMVMGALGRCGSGALDCLKKLGFGNEELLKWDLEETAAGGPFAEILDVDIFINCIYLSSPIPPFLSFPFIYASPSRNLQMIVDVSCDTTNPHNPLPIYSVVTDPSLPTVDVALENNAGPPLTVCSIDHLPSLLPRESSETYSQDLLPSLLELP
ncbi:Formate/glycerate dehydrogenase catalytic domain-like protein, partial [Atractiella rhizophila]